MNKTDDRSDEQLDVIKANIFLPKLMMMMMIIMWLFLLTNVIVHLIEFV